MLGLSPKLPLPAADGDLGPLPLTRAMEESSDPSVTSPISRPTGRAVAKSKRKGKVVASRTSFVSDDLIAEIRAMRIIRQRELEWMFEFRKQRIDLERKKEERKKLKMKVSVLTVLIGKDRLSPEEEELKCSLVSALFPK